MTIVDALKRCEGDVNLLNQYTSVRLKQWIQLQRAYEKDGVYLGERAHRLVQSVQYDMYAVCMRALICRGAGLIGRGRGGHKAPTWARPTDRPSNGISQGGSSRSKTSQGAMSNTRPARSRTRRATTPSAVTSASRYDGHRHGQREGEGIGSSATQRRPPSAHGASVSRGRLLGGRVVVGRRRSPRAGPARLGPAGGARRYRRGLAIAGRGRGDRLVCRLCRVCAWRNASGLGPPPGAAVPARAW